MFASRLLPASVLCAALFAGATACGGAKSHTGQAAAAPSASTVSAAASAAPVSAAPAAAASPSASPSPTGIDYANMTADQIGNAMQTALSSVTSMHLAGTFNTDDGKMTLDILSAKDDCDGNFSVAQMGSFEVVHIGNSTWLKPDSVFWHTIATQKGHASSGSALAELYKDKYLTGADNDPNLKSLAAMCDMVKALTKKDDSSGGSATKGAVTTVNGQSAIAMNVTQADGTAGGTIYLATQGQPYPLRLQQPGAKGGQVDFKDYNKPLNIQAPPADRVIDYAQVQKKVDSV
ncbi:hypothetical protein ACFYNO_07245 [Kitasatospora sp. NPDC006697]|uniref:hypothetical protein n=1 Tax=Kitasatospora sp. NPDC006697 TaxID=3364020 RepID=UPI0036947814